MSAGSSNGGWSAAEREIMQATYHALLEHGYADLSISRIATELDKSKAAIYYHYDSKDDLLIAFLAFAIDRFETEIRGETGDDPSKALDHVIEKLLPLRPDENQQQVQDVLMSLRSQAVTDEAFREQFTRIDDRLATTIQDIVRRGTEEDVFRDVDPTRVAEHVLATVNGAMYARATTNRESVAATRLSLSSYIDSELRLRG